QVGRLFVHSNPKSFEKYLKMQWEKSCNEQKEFLFVNAWNEWAEGTYLEPDEKYGYGYLRAVRRVKEKLMGQSKDTAKGCCQSGRDSCNSNR
ncbi:MAG TPA: glycoside hydrolase family 99-like domain-containing protein, partial [Lachnospiraceae bacterium]|nr:glycoside hydrolase family 99-like domain-containing protein [Lachnospiraceae bacterium]